MDEHNLFQVSLSNEQEEMVVVCTTQKCTQHGGRDVYIYAMIECVHPGLLEENRSDSMKKYL